MIVLTIGRSSDNDVVVVDSKVSRHHLQIIQHDDGSYTLSDFGSTNGTFVNEKRISGEVNLSPYDTIRIGNSTLPWKSYFHKGMRKRTTTSTKSNKLSIVLGLIGVLLVLALVFVSVFVFMSDNNDNSSLPEPIQYGNNDQTEETNNYLIKEEKTFDKPDEKQMALDLVGHSLTEGKEDGYYPSSWTWKIKDGEVSDLRILSVEEDNSTHYRVKVFMRLNSDTRSFDCKAVIAYKFNNANGWQIEMVKSLGIDVVKTHRYDECISVEKRYSFAFTETLHAINSCDVSLEIGGSYLCSYNNQWTKFCIVVSPNSEMEIDYSAQSDYHIDYVERP